MEVLDSTQPVIDPKQASPYPVAKRLGLMGGLCLIVYALLVNFFMRDPTEGAVIKAVVPLIITISVIVLAISKHKKEDLGGYITFGRAFFVGFVAIMIASVVSGVFDIILRTLIDPGVAAYEIERTREAYAEAGMQEAQIDQIIGYVEMTTQPLVRFGIGMVMSAIFGAVVAAIVAAFMQKERPASV